MIVATWYYLILYAKEVVSYRFFEKTKVFFSSLVFYVFMADDWMTYEWLKCHQNLNILFFIHSVSNCFKNETYKKKIASVMDIVMARLLDRFMSTKNSLKKSNSPWFYLMLRLGLEKIDNLLIRNRWCRLWTRLKIYIRRSLRFFYENTQRNINEAQKQSLIQIFFII